jgi:type IV secretory pathway VirB10-like protein
MSNSPAPDLPSPGLASWAKLALAAAGGIAVLGSGAYWYATQEPAPHAPRAQKLFAKAELPEDFFPAPDVDEAPTEPPKDWRPLKPGDKYPALVTPAVAAQEPTRIDFAAVRAEQERTRINELRREGLVMTANKEEKTYERVEWTNTDTDYKAQGFDKAETTFPVDLERTITADRFIPAILIPEINSELEGKVVAQVETHVYGAHGRKILIPAGSKAIGRYLPFKKAGQERLRIVWERIITPEGINIKTTDAQMADAMGRSGITGEVDNRNWDKYGMAVLVSMISAIGQLHVPADSVNQKAAIDAFGRELSRVTADILQQSLDIKPRVTIPAGSRILISPIDDIWFKKPVKNVVQVSFVREDKKGAKR